MKKHPAFSFRVFRRQRGMTLVELMIASVLSLFLMAGVIQLFLGTRQIYRFLDALSRLQENGRFALNVMAADIRMAGFDDNISDPVSPDAIRENTNGMSIEWVINNNLFLRRYVVQNRSSGGIVPSCVAARTSLFVQKDNGTPQELIEGVESMRLRYGVCPDVNNDGRLDGPPTDDSNTGVFYVDAATVSASNAWNRVCSVRINLLLTSLEDNIVAQPQPYFFPPESTSPTTPNDRCLRQAFSTTVAIRNRMP